MIVSRRRGDINSYIYQPTTTTQYFFLALLGEPHHLFRVLGASQKTIDYIGHVWSFGRQKTCFFPTRNRIQGNNYLFDMSTQQILRKKHFIHQPTPKKSIHKLSARHVSPATLFFFGCWWNPEIPANFGAWSRSGNLFLLKSVFLTDQKHMDPKMSVYETCTPPPQKKNRIKKLDDFRAPRSVLRRINTCGDPTYGWTKKEGSWKKPTVAGGSILETHAGTQDGNFRKSSTHPFFRCELFVLGSAIHLCGAWNCWQTLPR